MEIENSFNLEAEKICLSHLMTCGEFELLNLNEDDFFLETHRIVFQVISSLHDMGRAYKFIDVIDFLENHKVNKLKEPKNVIAGLMDTAYFEIESSLEIVKDRSVRRKLASASAQIERATANLALTPEEILGNAQDALFNIEKNVAGERYKISSAQELAVSFFETITAPKQKLPNLGWYTLDNILNGIRPCLYLVAGGTGMGKTSFMMAMAKQLMMNHNLPVIYFTPEMTAHQLTLRMIGSISGINYAEIEKIGLNQQDSRWGVLSTAINDYSTLPFYINDNATPTMGIIESDIRKVLAKTADNKAVIFIDYLQQLPPVGRDGDSASELGRRMQMLDNIAKKFQLPMFVGCQINRANASTNDKRPDLNSIRGSGEICEKSAVVLGLHRPGYYTRDYTDVSFEVIVLKNRWGRMDETAYFRCDLGTSKFEDTAV